MLSFRIELFGHSTTAKLRFFGSDGRLIDERSLAGSATTFVEDVRRRYEAPVVNWPQLGRELHNWLDGAPRWLAQLPNAADGVALHLQFDNALADLPWELLFQDVYWCVQPHRPFTPVRRLGRPAAAVAARNRPLRVLFMAAAPTNVEPPLAFEREEALILEATHDQEIELVVEESGSLEGLRQRLEWAGQDYFDVVHLTGHADIVNGKPCLLLEDDLGCRQDASAEDIAAVLAGNWPRLLFLSGCKTGMAAATGSLAAALLHAGAPAVLAWALPVQDEGASQLAARLYHWLGIGRSIDEAVARARQALQQAHSDCWHRLRLYADATPLSPLVTVPSTPNRPPLTVRPADGVFLDALSTRPVCGRGHFVGRRRLLQSGLRILQSGQGNEDYAEGVLLYGMGGLGKTSLAVRLCERLPTWQRLVWVGRLDEASFLRVLGDRIDDADTLAALNNDRLPLANRLRLLLNGDLQLRKALFVFDDFEENAEEDAGGLSRFDGGQRLLVRPEALAILKALRKAIRETNSASRIIVTCRHDLPEGNGLKALGLDGLKQADLNKKLDLLKPFKQRKAEDQAAQRARELAGGNPRLLERLAQVLSDPPTDEQATLQALEGVAEEFREEILLRALLDQQHPEARRLLARLAVFWLPVERPVVAEMAGSMPFEDHLRRAVAVGLVERIDDAAAGPRWLVSPVTSPLLSGELTDDERQEALTAAVKSLHQAWWRQGKNRTLESGLELHRLSVAALLLPTAAEVADALATHLIRLSRYREALLLCEITRTVGEDYRILHTQGRAEMELGRTMEAAAHYKQALEHCASIDSPDETTIRERAAMLGNIAALENQSGDVGNALQLMQQSLTLQEKIGDVKGKATTLHNMAHVIAQQGDVARALELWQQSLKLKEQIGDVGGEGATLHEMGGVIAQQGDVARALELWQQSLKLREHIGDVKGKAATLHNMAHVIAQQGDVARALELWQQSLTIQEQIGDVGGKAATLHNMAGVIAMQGDVGKALERWQESLTIVERIGDVKGKAATLHNMAYVIAQQGDVGKALELWQQSLTLKEQIGDVRGKAATLHNMAYVIAQQGDVCKALELWQRSLTILEQIGDVNGKAATLANVAGVIAQQGDVARALDLWQQSLKLREQSGDVRGKATTLANMAGVIAQQGDADKAVELWQQSLTILEQVGDVNGKAAALANVAGVIAQQGDVARALDLWQQSLMILDQIGDLKGKAATLANMAWASHLQGDTARARQLSLEAAQYFTAARAWLDLVTVLNILAAREYDEAIRYLAQSLWLAMRVASPIDASLNTVAALFRKLSPASPIAPLLGAAAIFLARTRGENHPKREEIQQVALAMMAACAEAHHIPDEQFLDWMEKEKLLELSQWRPKLDTALDEIVGTDHWLFDRSLFEQP